MKKALREAQARLLPEYSGCVFSYGNKKLPRTHMIMNLTSARNCPSKALGMCEVCKLFEEGKGRQCYAEKCESIRPEYLRKNLAVERWLKEAKDDDVVELVLTYIDAAPEPITHIRLNEAGDFRGQSDVDLVNRIADAVRPKGITVYGWTARTDIDFSFARFIVNGSTDEVQGAVRVFRATPAQEFDALPKNAVRCAGNCRVCHICHSDKYRGVVYCRMH